MPAEPSRLTRCGVLGRPIAHSLSPVLHRAAYGELGLDWQYDAYDVGASELPGFVAGLSPRWRGLSLTMPLKRAVIDLCDAVESRARLLGSVNTVVIDRDGTRRGHNTDVDGLVRALRAAGVDRLGTAAVLGAGATAASAIAAFAELGARTVTVLARSVERAAALSRLAEPLHLALTLRPLGELAELGQVDALVSTIPVDAQPPLATGAVSAAAVVLDAVYDPPRTPLLTAGRQHDVVAVPGFELLLHQAARQVELMTGLRDAPIDAMRAAGDEALRLR